MSKVAIHSASRWLGYDTRTEITGRGFRAMARTIPHEEPGQKPEVPSSSSRKVFQTILAVRTTARSYQRPARDDAGWGRLPRRPQGSRADHSNHTASGAA